MLTSRPPTFPSTAWGCRPKTLRSAVRYAHCLTTKFSCGKLARISAKTFSMSQKSCVRASKVFSLLPRCVFGFRAHSQSLARLVFVLRECSRGFPGTFSAFGSIPTTSTAHFQTSGAFPRLPLLISGLREHSQGFPGGFSAFGSVPSQRVALLCLSGVCPNAHTGIVRAWRGNHTKSFHQEDEPWQRRQLQR